MWHLGWLHSKGSDDGACLPLTQPHAGAHIYDMSVTCFGRWAPWAPWPEEAVAGMLLRVQDGC